ncbi:MAG TPA: ATP-binding protein [Verrucomicrobiae bacterium]|nr:ATP-binding protein [Verrucomicrobiae bacterium]
MFSVRKKPRPTANSVQTIGDLVKVTLVGSQDKALSIKTLAQFREALRAVKTKHDKVFVLVDVTGMTPKDVTTYSRVAIKEAFSYSYDGLAAVGRSHLLEVAMYLIRAGQATNRARYFTSERKAFRYLGNLKHPHETRNKVPLVGALFLAAISVAGLYSWQTGYLTWGRWVERLHVVNPTTCIGLLVLAAALWALWSGHKQVRIACAWLCVVLGVSAFVPNLHLPLFVGKLEALGQSLQPSHSTAICFVLAAISLLVVDLKGRDVKLLRYALGGIILATALFNAFGTLYALGPLSQIGPSFKMSMPAAVSFEIMGLYLLSLARFGARDSIAAHVSRVGWLIIALFMLVQSFTFVYWEQSVARNKADSQSAFVARSASVSDTIENRMQAYVDALYGFRGLFAASDGVDMAEFNTYYNSIDLAAKYPGLRAATFISRVKTPDLPALVALRNADQSAKAAGSPTFKINQPVANVPVHYILTYVANSPTSTGMGNDFTSDPVRFAAYEKAVKDGVPTASSPLTFNAATPSAQTNRGFFITSPMSSKASTERVDADKYVGLVSAVFYYDEFFKNLFRDESITSGLEVVVSDTASGEKVFSPQTDSNGDLRNTALINIADRTWRVQTTAATGFGIKDGQNILPRTILFAGQAFSVLLLIIFVLQQQARKRALQLADDITADLQHERNRAIALQRKDDAILSSIGDAVFAVDSKKRITLFNPVAAGVSGFTEEEALDKPFDTILKFTNAKDKKRNDKFIDEALDGKVTAMKGNTVLARKDGSFVPVADSAAPIRDSEGKIMGVIVVFRDITKEQELDRAKSEFVSVASHQLRTPLSAMNWYTEMLLNGDAGKLTKDQATYLQEIYTGNKRMVELVNSLLDTSRLDLGKLANNPEDVSVPELLDSLHKEMQPAIGKKSQQYKQQIEKGIASLYTDPKLIRMIVQNLMSNAVKYTPDKGIVSVTVKKDDAKVEIAVNDTGFGIPAAQQDKIFTKMFRADNVLEMEGTGLGLYIVREAARKLGGDVSFTSEEGKGSTFVVTLPAKGGQKKAR